MSETFEDEVLDELGDDRLQEIAGLLGTDPAGAQAVVGGSVAELSGGLRQAAAEPASADEVRAAVDEVTSAEPPLQGVAGFGGLAAGRGLGGGEGGRARRAGAAWAGWGAPRPAG
ncbi:DUF937 domain-containing protein, partial [Streptomyces sp. NPDC059556]|uniref:DUF937 domain-containing protein n=1 Tax=Streptomyces sp. NPDC059556 TaxID=3346863 RepID=UPI00368B72A7